MNRDSFWTALARKLEQPVSSEVDQRLFRALEQEAGRSTSFFRRRWRILGLASAAAMVLVVLWMGRPEQQAVDSIAAADFDVELLESLEWMDVVADEELQQLAELSDEEFEQVVDN